MNLSDAKAELKGFLESHWSTCPVVWENETKKAPKDPAQADPKWIAAVLETTNNFIGFGSLGKRHREMSGIFTAYVFTAVGTKDDAVLGVAEDFGDLLYESKLSGFQFNPPMIRPTDAKADDAGKWFGFEVHIPWILTDTV